MQTRIAAEVPQFGAQSMDAVVGQLPEAVRDGFSSAMGQSLLLPAAALLLGVLAAAFMARPRHMVPQPEGEPVVTGPVGSAAVRD
jgi:hypothetical protein